MTSTRHAPRTLLLGAFALLASLALAACDDDADATPTPSTTPTPEVSSTATLEAAATPAPVRTATAASEVPASPTATGRSGVWLVEVSTGDATLLSEGRETAWVDEAGFDAGGLPFVRYWDADRAVTVRYDLGGTELAEQSPGAGCATLDEDTVAVVPPGSHEPREFDRVTCGVISPDHRHMTYRVDAGTQQADSGFEIPLWDQWLIDLVTDERTLLRAGMRSCGGCDTGFNPGWSPSGRYVTLPELVAPGDVFLADTLTGSTRPIGQPGEATYRGYQPVWARRHDRLVYPAANGGTIFEDLETGTRVELPDLQWPAAFDTSDRYLYSPAWSISGTGATDETTVFDLVTGTVAGTRPGTPSTGLEWGATGIPVAAIGPDGNGGFAAALEDATGCDGTTLYAPGGAALTCELGARSATFSPDGSLLALSRIGSRYDLVILDVDTGLERLIVTSLHRGPIPSGFVWNEAGTHILVTWPAWLGL